MHLPTGHWAARVVEEVTNVRVCCFNPLGTMQQLQRKRMCLALLNWRHKAASAAQTHVC